MSKKEQVIMAKMYDIWQKFYCGTCRKEMGFREKNSTSAIICVDCWDLDKK